MIPAPGRSTSWTAARRNKRGYQTVLNLKLEGGTGTGNIYALFMVCGKPYLRLRLANSWCTLIVCTHLNGILTMCIILVNTIVLIKWYVLQIDR